MSEVKHQPTTATGVDGCPAGWFYIELKSSTAPSWGIVQKLAELVGNANESDRIFIDIPIGLQDSPPGIRECDRLARKKLGSPRQSSVFPAPVRAVLCASNYEEAKRLSQRVIGKKITKQAFAIIPKIREVDKFLRDDKMARRVVRETHPEICFWALAGRPMKNKKKKPEGYRERIAVLESVRPSAGREIEEILKQFPRKFVARDDVVDAMVAAITATASADSLQTLPPCPDKDSQGLPMEMVYAPAHSTTV